MAYGLKVAATALLQTIESRRRPWSTAGDDVGGIHLYWRSPAFPGQRNTVHGNIVVGFRYAINDNCSGNHTSHNWIYQNRLSSGIYRRAGTGYAGRIEHNVSQANPNEEVVPIAY